ncbi:MAG: hypothetical protein ACFFD2_15770 [Promethearchaeota archaeon]
MTDLETIISDNWDEGICTKPSFISLITETPDFYQRIIGTRIDNDDDRVKDAMDRKFFDPDSHDGYIIHIVTQTSYADLKNMIQAIKKVCATYSPTSAENVLDWERGTYKIWNDMRWEYINVILVYKAGIAAY